MHWNYIFLRLTHWYADVVSDKYLCHQAGVGVGVGWRGGGGWGVGGGWAVEGVGVGVEGDGVGMGVGWGVAYTPMRVLCPDLQSNNGNEH